MRKTKRHTTRKPLWILVVLVLLGIGYLTLWSVRYLAPLLHQETMIIKVNDKRTYTINREVCELRGPQGGCVVSRKIVETSYSVIPNQEDFMTREEIYRQIKVGGQYEVVVNGWYTPLNRREIIHVQETTVAQ